jgi:hypothetical protein
MLTEDGDVSEEAALRWTIRGQLVWEVAGASPSVSAYTQLLFLRLTLPIPGLSLLKECFNTVADDGLPCAGLHP